MRIFKHHSIMRCIYALVLALPMFSIFGRVIYTQSNSKANESYSGTQQVYEKQARFETNDVNSLTDIQIGNIYHADELRLYEFTYGQNVVFNVYSCEFINIDPFEYDEFYVEGFISTNSYMHIELDMNNGYYACYLQLNYDSYQLLLIDLENQGEFTLTNCDIVFEEFDNTITLTTEFSASEFNIYDYVLTETSTLDNAFDYSLSTFVTENDFGKLNLFEWFWSIFLTNNSQNMLYIHFVNWYMNYVLLVSSAYILFLVLMWFINFSRRILERGMNYDW